jgi:DNA-binding Lrp family transcriptional regulator
LNEVVELRRMFGLPDYFVRAATRDIRSYEAFIADQARPRRRHRVRGFAPDDEAHQVRTG